MTAVLLIATILDTKIPSFVLSYRFELLPSHRTSTVGLFVRHCGQYQSCITDVYVHSRFRFRSSVYGFSQAAFVSSGAAFTVFRELRLCLPGAAFRNSIAAFMHTGGDAYRSCVCGTVAAQQRKWFLKRSVIFKDMYRTSESSQHQLVRSKLCGKLYSIRKSSRWTRSHPIRGRLDKSHSPLVL